ncbi:AAA family ATPase [Gracilimonas sp.]|uniref:AAA family ATPase n=1 Tax=Gracilimonas sp. TaxID=1974203 RepID=UPI002872835C|nr:AAA family ATPase [Gracilimonas sp.]
MDDKRGNIFNKLHEVWLGELRLVLVDLLNEDAKKTKQYISQTLQKVEEGNTEEAIKYYADNLMADLSENKKENESIEKAEVSWISQISEITKDIEEEISLVQEEERFKGGEDDSLYVKSGKLLKRGIRVGQNTVTGIGGGIRKLFGGEAKAPSPWKQEIPLKNLIRKEFYSVEEWIREWNNELHRLEVEIALEADAYILHSTGLVRNTEDQESEGEINERYINPSQEDVIIFLKQAINQLERLQKKYDRLLDERLQSISEDIKKSLSKTGTFEWSMDNYSDQEIKEHQNQVATDFQKNEETWNELKSATVNRLLLSIGFTRLCKQVMERVNGFSSSLNEFFNSNIEQGQLKLKELLEDAVGIFDRSEEQTSKEVRELSEKHQQGMKEHCEAILLKPISELMHDAVLGTKLDRFTSAIPEWTKDQPGQAVLVERLDMTQFPPKYEFNKVEWQTLVQRVINNYVAKEFLPKNIKPEEFLSEVYQQLKEISEIIFTNLEIVDEVKKTDEEDPLEVAKEGLQRAGNKLDESIETVQKKKHELEHKLSEKTDFALTKLANLLDKQDVNEVRIAGAQYKAKETATDWKTKLQSKWAAFAEKIELFTRFIWKKTKKYAAVVQKFLGFVEKEKLESDKTDLATFLSETDEKIAELPFIYRRLFDFHKEVDERFFIRRPEQFDRFKKGYELWQNNFPSTFAVVGEKGSGKTLFVKMLANEVLTKNEVITINFEETIWEAHKIIQKISKALKIDDTSNVEELIEAIGRKKKRIVVILENMQNCFIRNISGFEAMEHLLFLISETNKNILWITTSTRYGWLFLDKVLNIGDYFTHTAEADNLSPNQIQDLILKRHMSSGYQLKFLTDETTKKSRSYRKLMDNEEKTQEYLRDKYFERLAKLSEGNSSVALIYWIRSIDEFDDTHFYIKPFNFGTISRIEELESGDLFALAAFVVHDLLMPKELSKILHQPLRESKLTMSRLASRSIIYKTEHGYLLNHLIYRQVVRVLKKSNYIH